MKKIIILGAGITGLTLAWKLRQKFQDTVDITIIEAQDRIGGWIKTKKIQDILLDLGPKGFSPKGDGLYTMQLIKELHLDHELVSSDNSSRNKYIFSERKMKLLTFRHIFLKGIIPFIFKDLLNKSSLRKDDSLYNFLSRHMSRHFLENTVCPVITSIKAGDVRLLSAKNTFPYLWELEEKYGSILQGLIKNRKTIFKYMYRKNPSSLFSLKNGLETLVATLENKSNAQVLLDSPIHSISIHDENNLSVHTKNTTVEGNVCFYTLPLTLLPSLVSPQYNFVHDHLKYWSISCMAFGWNSPSVNPHKGYGLVIKRHRDSQILGIVWNSRIFPKQEIQPQTRISLILSGAPEKHIAYELCLQALKKYLNISLLPDYSEYFPGQDALPQMLPYFHLTKLQLEHFLPSNFKIAGQNISGPGINRCIKSACELVASL